MMSKRIGETATHDDFHEDDSSTALLRIPSESVDTNTQDTEPFGSSVEDHALVRLAFAEIPTRYSTESSIYEAPLLHSDMTSETDRRSSDTTHHEGESTNLNVLDTLQQTSAASNMAYRKVRSSDVNSPRSLQRASVTSTAEQSQLSDATKAHDSDTSVQQQPAATEQPGFVRISGTGWRPVTLRVPLLMFTLCLTLSLAAVVLWCLKKSQRKQGLLFAPKISQLSFWHSFAYLYLPTLLSVLYGLYFSWIDLDVKRMEPFFQMSSVAGAAPEDSILLDYPFQFLPNVPLKASKRGHWSVVASSVAFLLVSWFLTPFQAGMFAVRTITVTEEVPAFHATSYTPLEEQEELSAITAQYVYNIAWFNESLPPYMTKDFVLAALGPKDDNTVPLGVDYNFTSSTLLYGVDVDCERAISWNETSTYANTISTTLHHNSTRGCEFYPPDVTSLSKYRDRDDEFPNGSNLFAVDYRAQGINSYNRSSSALPPQCPDTFWIRWTKLTITPENLEAFNPTEDESTSLFCTAFYFQQEVDATLAYAQREVISVRVNGEKKALPADMFNMTAFEVITNEGGAGDSGRLYDLPSTYPRLSFPEQQNRLRFMPTLFENVSPMAAFAIALYPRPAEAYMDAETLQASYTAAYRLLFARQLAEVLSSDIDPSTERHGLRQYYMEAVQVVPTFAYIVLGILGLIAGSICWLAFLTMRRDSNLLIDPGSISNVMALIRTSPGAITTFTQLNHSGLQQLDAKFFASNPRFALRSKQLPNSRYTITLTSAPPCLVDADSATSHSEISTTRGSRPGARPFELRALAGAIFVGLQTLALVVLAGLYSFARSHNGLQLPTTSTVARQILENYLPIVAATLIEAFWMVLNRLVCLLQPWEELHSRKAKARRSVDLNYNTVPPQLAFVRALKALHVRLAIICLMSILANVLAVSLGGLMFEDSAASAKSTAMQAIYAPTFKFINATDDVPFNSNDDRSSSGRSMMDQFYQAMSNITAGTDLPPWVDEQWAYLPVEFPVTEEASTYEVKTYGFGTAYHCAPLESKVMTYETISLDVGSLTAVVNLTVPVSLANGSMQVCTGQGDTFAGGTKRIARFDIPPSSGRYALELGVTLSYDVACEQHLVAGWIRADFVDLAREDWVHMYDGLNTTLENGTVMEVYPPTYYKLQLESMNQTLIDCKPDLLQVEAKIEVTEDGRVVRSLPAEPTLLTNEAFIKQANHFVSDNGATWHSNATSIDFVNWLMAQSSHSNKLVDPNEPVPAFEEVSSDFETMNRRLAAIVIAQNLPLLFEPAADNAQTTGSTLVPETRIFISFPAFVVSVAILCPYILTTMWLYVSRPWRSLPRLPTTLASIMAYVAPSNALRHMSIHDTEDDRVDRKQWKWGYGSYIGPDGKRHTGVEGVQWLLEYAEVIELQSTASETERAVLAQQ